MSVVNENAVVEVLKSHDVAAEITQLKWQINAYVVDAGNNYLSEVFRLIIEYVKDRQAQKRVIFVKVPFKSPVYKNASKWGIFLKELTVYTEILPQIYTFEEDYLTARCYYVDEKQSLFLKDLSQSGYKTVCRTRQLDFEHCAYALRNLAKLHGLSVHLEKTKGLPEIVRKDLFYNNDDPDDEIKKQMAAGLTEFYDQLDPCIRMKYAKRIEFFKSIDWTRMVEDLDPQSSSFNVVNHGDYRTNNIMFKYDKYGIIKKSKILDFQFCRWANPAIDLIYFAISSMKYEVYEKYFDLLCAIYLDTLNKILEKFGYPIYEMAQLRKDIEDRYAYGIFVLCGMLPIFMNDPNEPLTFTNADKDNELDPTAMQKTYKQKQYSELANKWFLHFAQKGIYFLIVTLHLIFSHILDSKYLF